MAHVRVCGRAGWVTIGSTRRSDGAWHSTAESGPPAPRAPADAPALAGRPCTGMVGRWGCRPRRPAPAAVAPGEAPLAPLAPTTRPHGRTTMRWGRGAWCGRGAHAGSSWHRGRGKSASPGQRHHHRAHRVPPARRCRVGQRGAHAPAMPSLACRSPAPPRQLPRTRAAGTRSCRMARCGREGGPAFFSSARCGDPVCVFSAAGSDDDAPACPAPTAVARPRATTGGPTRPRHAWEHRRCTPATGGGGSLPRVAA
jgi:hypothetical protein